MSATGTVPAPFIEAWIAEFVKSVEMFTGAVVAIEPGTPDADAAAPAEGVLWHEQAFERQDTGRLWIGVPTPDAVRLLGDAPADAASGAALFRELAAQSLKAAAELLNTSSHPGLKGLDTVSTEPPPPSSAAIALRITGKGEAIPVWLHCDNTFADLLQSPDRPAAPTTAASLPAQPATAAPDSLHGIDLPVVVVLGRATLRIAEVLKLTVGSIVELDTRVGDAVDVCIQGVVVARGEVVSIRGNYGVRIVEVLRRNRLQVQAASRPPRAPQPAVAAGLH